MICILLSNFMDQKQPFLICLHVEWIKITINFYTHFKMAIPLKIKKIFGNKKKSIAQSVHPSVHKCG